MAEGGIRNDWDTATTSHSDVEQVVGIMSGNVDKVLEKTAKAQEDKSIDSSVPSKKEDHPKLLKIVLIVAAIAFILLIILVWITSETQEIGKDEEVNSEEEVAGVNAIVKGKQTQTEEHNLNEPLLEHERSRNSDGMEEGFTEYEAFNTFPTEQKRFYGSRHHRRWRLPLKTFMEDIAQFFGILLLSEDTYWSTSEDIEGPSDEVTLPISETNEINEDGKSGSAYQVKDIYGDPCILLEVNCSIRFFYTTEYGDTMATDEEVPANATTEGHCGHYMIITWGIFAFRWSFKQTLSKSRWYVNKIELVYILSDSQDLFQNISTSGFQKLRTPNNKRFKLFKTPMGKSYVCSTAHVGLTGDDMTATLLLENLQLQAFVKNGEFGPEHVCTLFRDETAPLALGSTFAILTLITVSGFGVHRHLQLKKQLYE